MIEIIPNWHPIFVHFTVALLLTSSVLFIVSKVLPESTYQKNCLIVARWNLWIGMVITIGTLIAGGDAFNSVINDTPSHISMTIHRAGGLITASCFFILAAWQIKCRLHKNVSFIFLVCIIIASSLLLATAYKGGELVFRHGLGVMSLPLTK